MVYLAELLVVMTDGLKIVRICADTSAYRRRRFSLSRKATVSRAQCLVETQKIVCRQHANVWQWLLRKKFAVTACPLHFDTKSEQSDCNKSSIR